MKFDKKNVVDILPLNPMQEAMLFQYLKNPDSDLYYEQICLNISDKLDYQAMYQAWDAVIQMNEMLRTVFVWEKVNAPMQIIFKEMSGVIKEYDLTAAGNETEKARLIDELVTRDRQERFDLQTGPLIRVKLCKCSENDYVIIISNHHILYDGWSNGIILRDFLEAYAQTLRGKNPSIKQKVKYKEYLHWYQNRDRAGEDDYWKGYLQDYQVRPLLPLAENQTDSLWKVAKYIYELPEEFSEKINNYVKDVKSTLGNLFYIIWGILLQKYNHTDDVVFGTPVSGRSPHIHGIEEMVGLFINTLPFRLKTSDDVTISQLIYRVNEDVSKRGRFEYTPLTQIRTAAKVVGNKNLFDSLVVIVNYPLFDVLDDPRSELQINSYQSFEKNNFDLTLEITISRTIQFNYSYNSDLYEVRKIKKIAADYFYILKAIIQNPDTKLSEIGTFPVVQLPYDWPYIYKSYTDGQLEFIITDAVDKGDDLLKFLLCSVIGLLHFYSGDLEMVVGIVSDHSVWSLQLRLALELKLTDIVDREDLLIYDEYLVSEYPFNVVVVLEDEGEVKDLNFAYQPDLLFSFAPQGSLLAGRIIYNSNLFESDTIYLMHERYLLLLKKMTSREGIKLSEIEQYLQIEQELDNYLDVEFDF